MPNTYAEALNWASLLLSPAGQEVDNANFILEVQKDWTPSQRRLHQDDAMSESEWQAFSAAVQRLLNDEPAQYIVGKAPFLGEWFTVTPDVLIPRFETEELVDWVITEQAAAKTGLDMGTGSGIIGLTLMQHLPDLAMTLVDLSPAALAVAKINAEAKQLQPKFVQSDLFANLGDEKFDFIVANLPYIDHAEEDVMDTSTKKYEPELALFAEHHGLAVFEHFAQMAMDHLNPDGAIYLEFGYHQRPALAALFDDQMPGFTQTFRRDLAGHQRMLRLQVQKGTN